MSIIWSNQIDPILSRGISLEQFGIRNWVLNREEALQAVCEIEALGIAVLGGDVYQLVEGEAKQNYDSWYCDQTSDESEFVFFKRSTDMAKAYILSYSMPKAFFALVPKI
jgi:hypothetical protein